MRQDFFTYMPQFKLMISGNNKPGLIGELYDWRKDLRDNRSVHASIRRARPGVTQHLSGAGMIFGQMT